MVRFKNRYILADYSHIQVPEDINERSFLKLVKQVSE
jgi:hypothetical protein